MTPQENLEMDLAVSNARQAAVILNEQLDKLEQIGVRVASVFDTFRCRYEPTPITRVELVLMFPAQRGE